MSSVTSFFAFSSFSFDSAASFVRATCYLTPPCPSCRRSLRSIPTHCQLPKRLLPRRGHRERLLYLFLVPRIQVAVVVIAPPCADTVSGPQHPEQYAHYTFRRTPARRNLTLRRNHRQENRHLPHTSSKPQRKFFCARTPPQFNFAQRPIRAPLLHPSGFKFRRLHKIAQPLCRIRIAPLHSSSQLTPPAPARDCCNPAARPQLPCEPAAGRRADVA